MRQIVITFSETPERKEVETQVTPDEAGQGTRLEDAFLVMFLPHVIKVMTAGAKAVVIGTEPIEKLRTAAQLDVDIREAGR